MPRHDARPRYNLAILASVLLIAAGCGSGAPDPSAPAADDRPGDRTQTVPFEGTAGIVEQESATGEVALVAGVRAARHEGYDRIVFEMEGSILPGYHLEYVDRPVRQCGSGNPVEIAGDGWLEIRMEPARGHDEAGSPTIPRRLEPDLPVLAEAVRTCDFEAVVTFVLGVRSPNRFRVTELEDPARLVVDVRH